MTDMGLHQIVLLSFSLLLILRVSILFILRKKTFRELFVAYFLWIGLGSLVYFSTLFDSEKLSNELYLSMITISLIITFYATFNNIIKTEKLQNSVTRIIRRQAIEEYLEHQKQDISKGKSEL